METESPKRHRRMKDKNGNSSTDSSCDAGKTTLSENMKLKKELGLIKAISFIVGTIIGSGIFISPQGVLRGTGSVGLSLVVWLVCGLVSLAGALCFTELSIVTGKSGSQYIFLKEAYGDIPAFLYSWTSSLLMRPGGTALVAIALGTYVTDFVLPGDCPTPGVLIKLFAALFVMTSGFLNGMSVKWTTHLHVVFTVSQVIVLLLICGVGLVRIFQGHTEYITPAVSFQGSNTNFFALAGAFYQGLFPYDGWNALSTIYEEVRNPKRNVPLSICIGMPVIILIYMFVNISYLTVLSPTEMLASSAVALTFSERSLGVMSWIVPLGICVSVFGSSLGNVLADSRLPFVTSREGHMAQILSMVSIRRTPLPGICLEISIALFLITIGSFDTLVYSLGFASWISYGAATLAVPILRYRLPHRPRPFKVPMILVVIVSICSLYLIMAPFINGPKMEIIYACLFILSGLIFYFPFIHFKYHPKLIDNLTRFLQRLLLVVPSTYDEPEYM